ncbi:unnamed protein product [Paramecium primaurelia]|uniref:Protein kinase domain-containing protein n=1 Tax=Paramecium primaurelia TaxID=5886 RepID=A0A8S1JM56_PARPR|nr:unnamed protein product [Paramecium primaurelia]
MLHQQRYAIKNYIYQKILIQLKIFQQIQMDISNLQILNYANNQMQIQKQQQKSFCGSPTYLPPELIDGIGSSKATDIYQIGIILFEMLTGYPPYFSTNIKTLIENIKYCKQNNFQIIKQLLIPKDVSAIATDLLKLLLIKSRQQRMTQINLHKIKKHLFFSEIDWIRLQAKQYKPPRLSLKKILITQMINLKFEKIKIDIDYKEDQEKVNFIDNWNIQLI